jgi:hypothetical protein
MAYHEEPARREERSMTGRTRPRDDSWKSKMGVEFSGLENATDFMVAVGIGVTFVILAMVIAYLAFG